jgi:hypothetical protein
VFTGERIGGVITCAHLFEDSQKGIFVAYPGVGMYRGIVVAIDPVGDFAILATARAPVTPAPISYKPYRGVTHAMGFGGDLNFVVVSGPFLKTTYASQFLDKMFQHISAVIRRGDSGGGVFNDKNQLIGVVVARTETTEDHPRGVGHPLGQSLYSDVASRADFTKAALLKLIDMDAVKDKADRMVFITMDGCVVCEQMGPTLEKLRAEGYNILTILTNTYNEERISMFPTLMFFYKGELVEKSTGYMSEADIRAKLKKVNE